ncbi:MAG TPA: type II toxin-antitoxin system RelE/ParE family toxin, partial [Tepidisphaeraceae bacterium]|nr:type II toxin-antitoxin system RelE/ParE family toxin [Tepidisphaeraceae bacterium]
LEVEPGYTAGFGRDVVKAYRKRLAVIRAAVDERAFYAAKSLHYEKLKGDRSHQRSMRLNDQFRLVLEIDTDAAGRMIVVVSVEDYH